MRREEEHGDNMPDSRVTLATAALALRASGHTWATIAVELGASRHDLVEVVAEYRALVAEQARIARQEAFDRSLFGRGATT
jgi:hypothetical protein